MAAGPFRLSVVIGASTTEAVSAIHGLETRLRHLQSQGGVRGGLAGGLATGLSGIRVGVSALGSTLSTASMAFGALGMAGRLAFGTVMLPLRVLTHAVSAGLRLAVGIGKTALAGLGAAAAAAGGAVYAAVKALGPAANRERTAVSWEVLLGSPQKAQKRVGFLKQFEAETPFDFREVDQGARLMQTFGIYSQRTLRIVGDAVSAFGKRIDDAVGPLSKLRQGLFESESLGLIGITRESLRAEGVRFGAQGNLETPGVEAYEAALRSLEKRFGGMMARISRTWEGLMSTLGSSWDNLWATLGERALGPAKGVLREIIGTVDDLARRAAGFEIPGLGKAVVAARMLRTLIGDLFDRQKRGELADAGMETARRVPEFLGGLGLELVGELGTLFGNFVTNFGGVVSLMGNVFVGAWRVGVALLREAWSAMSSEAHDKIAMAFEASPLYLGRSKPTTERVAAAEKTAIGETFRTPGAAGWRTGRNTPGLRNAWSARTLTELRQRLTTSGLADGQIDAIMAEAQTRSRIKLGYDSAGGVRSAAAEESGLQGTLAGMVKQARQIGEGLAAGLGEKLQTYLYGPVRRDAFGNVVTDDHGRPVRDRDAGALHRLGEPLAEVMGPRWKQAQAEIEDRRRTEAIVEARRKAAEAEQKPARTPMDDHQAGKLEGAAGKQTQAAGELSAAAGALQSAAGSLQSAARSRFGYEPGDISHFLGRSPRERAGERHRRERDERLRSKLDDAAAGEHVYFTPRERRELASMGVDVPRPRWAAEQDRLRQGSVSRSARLDGARISTIGDDLAERNRRLERSRIDMRSDAPKEPALTELLKIMARQLEYDREAAAALDRMVTLFSGRSIA